MEVETTTTLLRPAFLESKRLFWIVSALTMVLFLIANLPWHLDDHDQAKQAFTSFEMVKEGHWFYQHTPHEHVATKPPLLGWISAALFGLTRSWDVAWRLPSFLAAIALFVLLWRVATSAYGPAAGLIASSAFGLNLLSPRLATLVRTDMPLALVIFLLGVLIWRKIREQEPWKRRDRLIMFALLTAAMLIKGPIVYAFLLPGIALLQWRYSRQRPLATAEPVQGGGGPGAPSRAWFGWWPWLASLGIFLVWVFGGIFFERDFFNQVVVREFLARFDESVHRPQPLLFYVPHLLHKFFPWSFLVVAIAIADLRAHSPSDRGMGFQPISDRQPPSRESSGAPGDADATFWLVWWIFGGLIVMSLVPSKRVDRIFPIIPPLCLLLAAQISGRLGALRRQDPAIAGRRPYVVAVLLLAILFTSGYTFSKILSGYHDHRDALGIFGHAVRDEARTHHWRYELTPSRDEGMLLYMQKTHFLELEDAISEWNGGNLDAIVAPAEDVPALVHELHGATLSGLKPNERKGDRGGNYVLIVRSNAK